MKILTVCEGGNVRSVTLAYVLKNRCFDALACSWRFNSVDTKRELFEWADKIIVADEQASLNILEAYKDKVQLANIGPDRWLQALHPELVGICEKLLDVLGYIGVKR